jgi:hypothetical protein
MSLWACEHGGQTLSLGLDNGDEGGTARNGVLELGEVDSTANLCNGEDGVDGAGGVHLIDANGFDLGRMVGGSGFMSNNMTLVSNTGYVFALNYYDLTYYQTSVFFSNGDCTGTAFTYSPVQNGGSAIGGRFGVHIDTVGWYASVLGSYADNRSYAAIRSGETCYAQVGTYSGFTVTLSTAAVIGVPTAQPAMPASLQ